MVTFIHVLIFKISSNYLGTQKCENYLLEGVFEKKNLMFVYY